MVQREIIIDMHVGTYSVEDEIIRVTLHIDSTPTEQYWTMDNVFKNTTTFEKNTTEIKRKITHEWCLPYFE